MSDEPEKVCVITLNPTEDGGLTLQVDAEYETNADKRREIETEVALAAVKFVQAIANEVEGQSMTVTSMSWVPERLPKAQSAAPTACDPVPEQE